MSPRRALGSHLCQLPGLAVLGSCLNFSSFLVWPRNPGPCSENSSAWGWGNSTGRENRGTLTRGLGRPSSQRGCLEEVASAGLAGWGGWNMPGGPFGDGGDLYKDVGAGGIPC